MSAETTEHQWTGKSRLSGHLALALLGAMVLIFTYFKLKPYLASENKVHPYSGRDEVNHHSADAERKEKEIKNTIFTGIIPIPHFGVFRGADKITNSGNTHPRVRVIERPLFDGLAVTLQATLLRGISSLESSPRVEASLDALIREEETRDLDDSLVHGGKLLGIAAPNLDLKRWVLNFGELVTRSGTSFQVQATAIDPETQTQGIRGDYASGLGSRLLGVGISQVMTAGDQVLMAKVLPDPATATITQQVTSQAAQQMNSQAATDLSLEATKELRETKSELTLPAGTKLTIRLRVAPQTMEAGGGT